VGSGGSEPEILEERRVADVETLRLLADPLRLAILGAFPPGRARRAMSVKEIAERIDEGQTKLYRHVKKLEEAGLLRVAETRLVSGIVEKRYLPAQKRLVVEDSLISRQSEPDDYTDALAAFIDATRDRLRTEIRSGRVPIGKPERGPDLSPQIGTVRVNMTFERYQKVRAAVFDLLENLGASDEGPGTFPVFLQAVLFASVDPAQLQAGSAPGTEPAGAADQWTENPPSTKSS
jgi:DNA-binding transcriptional ArsR family regulator